MNISAYLRAATLVLCAFPAIANAANPPSTAQDSTSKSSMLNGIKIDDIVVYGSQKKFGAKDSQMSAIAINKEQIKVVPTYFGEIDVMKTLQKLPGVQTSSEGTAGIFVRGGNYDQNLISLDGSTLYNAEHLKGFVSAINADIVQNINFYRGAFPARYGSRLSSIVDIGVQAGDFHKYHGELSLGALSSRINVSGPIWKGHTSFNVAARVSYFDMVAYPTLRKYYDNKEAMKDYSDMNFYDITAKLVHKFSNRSKLSGLFYFGKDYVNTEPSYGRKFFSNIENDKIEEKYKYQSESTRSSTTKNSWGNMLSSIYFTSQINDKLWTNVNASYSRFKYQLALSGDSKTDISDGRVQTYFTTEEFNTKYHSGIEDLAITIDNKYTPSEKHSIRFGVKGGMQRFDPTVDVEKHAFVRVIKHKDEETHLYEYDSLKVDTDTILGKKSNVYHFSAYAEDDYSITNSIKANYGLRFSLYSSDGKTYSAIEPRFSLRWLFNSKMSIKASYSLMSQAVRLQTSNNLVMPSDIWVPITERVPLMRSHIAALGFNYDIAYGITASVEGYYKKLSNILEYRPGTSYTSTGISDWQDMTVLGKGRAYGIELYLSKNVGNTTGWISYTWSKSLRTMDRPGYEINAGHEYYASNDRRNNFSSTIAQHIRVSKSCSFDLSASWSYITGRRGIVPTIDLFGGMSYEYDPRGNFSSSGPVGILPGTQITQYPEQTTHLDRFVQFYTYRGFNNYKLPSQHHLDIGVNFSVKHNLGESIIGISVYNIYNRMNISNVYISYHNDSTVLKGVCLFPIMPSINYTHKF